MNVHVSPEYLRSCQVGLDSTSSYGWGTQPSTVYAAQILSFASQNCARKTAAKVLTMSKRTKTVVHRQVASFLHF